jgi:hypothetical protein
LEKSATTPQNSCTATVISSRISRNIEACGSV